MELLGLKKVGWVFSQPAKPRDYIMSSAEVRDMAALQVSTVQLCACVCVCVSVGCVCCVCVWVGACVCVCVV